MQRLMLVLSGPLVLIPLVVSPTRTLADPGNALHFDGDDTVRIPDSTDFDNHTALTVEMWIRADVLDLGGYLFDQFGPSPVNKGEWLVMLATYSPSSHPALTGYFRWPGVDRAAASQQVNITDGRWHHVAVARNGSDISLYVDGQLDVISKFGGSLSMHAALPIHIGSRGGFEQFWHGQIDEVRFWDYARTPDEIQNNFNRIVDPATPGLIGYWNFDEQAGDQSVLDVSPNGHHGTLGGDVGVGLDDPARVVSTAPIVGLFGECNDNNVDDVTDIAAGTSQDCNANMVPDECDLAGLFSVDVNTNGRLDECDLPGDLDIDGDVDFGDFTVVLAAYGSTVGDSTFNPSADFDGDGTIGIVDYQFWLQTFRSFVGNAQAAAPLGMRGDADFDQDVDLADFMVLQLCLNADPGNAIPCAIAFDFNGDGSANILDLTAFVNTVTGP